MIEPILQMNDIDVLSKKKTSSLISNEELKNIIKQLEDDITDGSCFSKDYSSADFKVMPELVMQANNEFPEMNLHFIKSPQDFSLELKKQ